MASDERIPGRGEFTEHALAEAASQAKETLRFSREVVALATLARTILAGAGVARCLGVTTSLVNRLAASEEPAGFKRSVNAL